MKKYIIKTECFNHDIAILIATEVVKLMNSGKYEDLDEAIFDEIDRHLRCVDNQRKIMEIYQNPYTADYDNAVSALFFEIDSIIEEV